MISLQRFVCGALLLLFLTPVPSLCSGWESIDGPYRVETRFHIRYPDGERLCVGSRAGTYLTMDGGTNWTNGNDATAQSRAVHLASNGTIFVVRDTTGSRVDWGTPRSILRSTDRGRTWTTVASGYKLALAPGRGDTLYMISGRSDGFGEATRLSRSTDLGNSWAIIATPKYEPPYSGFGRVYTQSNYVFLLATFGYYGDITKRSSDGGTTWDTLSCYDAKFTPPGNLLVHKHKFSLYGELIPGAQLDYSSDNGQTWATVLNSDSGFSSLVSNEQGSLFVLSQPGGVMFRSTNAGRTWINLGTFSDGQGFGRVFFSGSRRLFGVTKNGSYYRSSDLGTTWNAVLDSEGDPLIGTLQNSTDSLVVVSDPKGNWIESTDGGLNWSAKYLPYTMDAVNDLVVVPSQTLFAGASTGLFRRQADGSWYDYQVTGPVLSLASGEGSEFYVGNGIHTFFNGAVFAIDTAGPPPQGVKQLYGGGTHLVSNMSSICAVGAGRILVGDGKRLVSISVSEGPQSSVNGAGVFSSIVRDKSGNIYAGNQGGGIYRSTDNGNTWVQTNNGLVDLNVFSIARDSLGQIIAGTGLGAYRSDNKGATWLRMPNGLPETPVRALTVAPNGCIYAGTDNYVYVNIGNYWVHLRDGLATPAVLSLAAQGPNTIFAGTDGNGAYARGGFQQLTVPGFSQITSSAVLNEMTDVRAMVWGDCDNDGDADLFIANGGGQNNSLYRNDGGAFVKVILGAIVNDGGDSRGAAWGDYDNDGHVDLFVANYDQPSFLYHNNGNGSFTRVLDGPVATDVGGGSGCAWVDYDNDGSLDLFVCNTSDQVNFLYHNNGSGEFTRVSTGTIVTDIGNSVTCAWGDYNADGYPDLYVAKAYQPGALYKNNGNGTFTRLFTTGLTSRSVDVRSCGWADFSNDGLLDLWIASGSGVPLQLLVNQGNGTFAESSGDMIWTDADSPCPVVLGDIDNDNDLDLFVTGKGVKSIVYVNDGGGGMVRTLSGSSIIGNDCDGPVSLVDFNGDANLDLLVGNANGQRMLFANNGSGKTGLNLKLEGSLSNKRGVGAQVSLTAAFESYPIWLTESNSGRDDIPLHFGIRNISTIDTILVRWPVTGLQVLTNVPASGSLLVREPAQRSLPFLQYPPNGAIDVATTVILRWAKQSGATQFHLQVSTDSLFRSFEFNDSTLTDSSTQLRPFNLSTTYYWRVRGTGGIGVTDWTTRWKFVTVAPIPGSVSLLSPPQNALNIPASGLMRWTKSVRATRYQLQLSTDSTFATGLTKNDSTLVDTVTTYFIGHDSAYYWHVRAINGVGRKRLFCARNV